MSVRKKIKNYHNFISNRYLWRISLFLAVFASVIFIFASQIGSDRSGGLVFFGLLLATVAAFLARIFNVDCYQCRRALRFVYHRRKKIKTLAIGHTIDAIINWLFDNPLYIFVIAQKGPLVGGVVMMLLSLAACLATILFYNWSKIDWLGFHVINEMRDNGDEWIARAKNIHIKTPWMQTVARLILHVPAKFLTLIIWLLKRGNVTAFFTLSIVKDPFITITYLRRGSFTKFTNRDWRIFLASVVVSNTYWTLRSFAILEIILAIYRAIVG